MKPVPCLCFEEALRRLSAPPPGHARAYAAMYSSQWNAIVTDPRLMLVPVDDHLVHRGDGVFETLLWEAGRVYNLSAHLDRLHASAQRIGLTPPMERLSLVEMLETLFGTANLDRALGRLLVGRGPGGFSVSPSESVSASLYAVVYPAPPPFMESHPGGARARFSQIPPKAPELATIKTCNYLPNALMKAEAEAAGVDFVVGLDASGLVTESFTENIVLVQETGALRVPPPVCHLPGTTLKKVLEFAREEGVEIIEEPFGPSDVLEAAEVLVIGTTAHVTSVTEFEGRAYPVGPVGTLLGKRLLEDIRGARNIETKGLSR